MPFHSTLHPFFRCATGWSKGTVNCNFFLSDPKIPRSVITQWFLESSYREVLVFWCFKVSGAWSFAFLRISNTELLLLHTRPEHSKTPLHSSKPYKHTYTSPIWSQSPPPLILGQFWTTTDTKRNQQTPNDTNRWSQAPQKAVQGCVEVPVDIEWHLLVSGSVWRRLLVFYGVWRCEKGSQEFLKGYLSCCCGRV